MPPDTIELCIPLQGGARPRPPRQPRLRHSTGGSVSCRSFTPPTHHSATSRHDTHMHIDLCHNQHKPADWPSGLLHAAALQQPDTTHQARPPTVLCVTTAGVSDLTPRETLAAGSCACAEKERNTSHAPSAPDGTCRPRLGGSPCSGGECGGLFSLVWNNKEGQTELGTQTLPLICSINAET